MDEVDGYSEAGGAYPQTPYREHQQTILEQFQLAKAKNGMTASGLQRAVVINYMICKAIEADL